MTGENDTTDELRTDGGSVSRQEASFVEYGIDDKPPMLESIFLGVQHYLTMIGATVAIPLVLVGVMEGAGIDVAPAQTAQLIGTFFVVSGVATLAQTTIGNRYPIVQGGTFALLAPAIAIIFVLGAEGAGFEATLRQLQGAIIVAALVQVVIGYSGLLGKLKYYLSPVVVAPVIVLIGLSLVGVDHVTDPAMQNWWLLGLALLLIILFSQYLDQYSRYARMFPVLLGIGTAWIVAAVLSAVGFYTEASHTVGGAEEEGASTGYIDPYLIAEADIIMPIMPFQWGLPELTVAFAIGIFAGILASIIESLGDYYAVARIAGMGAPSEKRINHGIGMEGLGNVFAGVMGTGNGSTSYGENIGAIAITGVASRYVVQVGAIVMLIVGFFGPFGALVATIPAPIVGALFIAMFGQIAAIGLSNLKYVDLDASRNIFIIGIALFVGLAMPIYMSNVETPANLQEMAEGATFIGPIFAQEFLGVDIGEALSTTVFVIGSTAMAVGGIVAFVLDNTIRGTREERGLSQWESLSEDEDEFQTFFERMFGDTEKPPVDRAD